jgi:IS30 family transposase
MGVVAVVRLSEDERARIAELWAAGMPQRMIGREMGRPSSTIRRHIDTQLRTRPVRERSRSPLRLSLAEREDISRGLAAGESLRGIAARLGRAPSTVSREVKGHGGRDGYRAVAADEEAWRRALRPKEQKLASCELLRWLVEAALERRWSPEQIAGWLRRSFPDQPELWVSHETIYQSLYVQARGALRKELAAYLRRRQVHRKPRGHSTYNGQGRRLGVHRTSQTLPRATWAHNRQLRFDPERIQADGEALRNGCSGAPQGPRHPLRMRVVASMAACLNCASRLGDQGWSVSWVLMA